MQKSREEGEPSFSGLRNATLVKAETKPRVARLADGKLKESKSMKYMVKLSDIRSDEQCMKNMNGGLSKQINMHVGEVVHRVSELPCKTVSCMRQQ